MTYSYLGLESLKQRRWFRKLCYFFKITKNQSPKYLSDKMPTKDQILGSILFNTFINDIFKISLFLRKAFYNQIFSILQMRIPYTHAKDG